MALQDRVEDRLQVMAAAVSGVGAVGADSSCSGVGGPDLLEPTFSPYTAATTDDMTTGLSGMGALSVCQCQYVGRVRLCLIESVCETCSIMSDSVGHL